MWSCFDILCCYGNYKSDQVTHMVCNVQACVLKHELERDQNLLNVTLHTRNATDDSPGTQGLLLKSTG